MTSSAIDGATCRATGSAKDSILEGAKYSAVGSAINNEIESAIDS